VLVQVSCEGYEHLLGRCFHGHVTCIRHWTGIDLAVLWIRPVDEAFVEHLHAVGTVLRCVLVGQLLELITQGVEANAVVREHDSHGGDVWPVASVHFPCPWLLVGKVGRLRERLHACDLFPRLPKFARIKRRLDLDDAIDTPSAGTMR